MSPSVYDFVYELEPLLELFSGLNLTLQIPSSLLGIASYVLTALALYTIAQRRGIRKSWLAWIPVADSWLLGSLSDQYQYVVHGQNKRKRRTLLTLSIVKLVLSIMLSILLIVMIVNLFLGFGTGNVTDAALLDMLAGPLLGMAGLLLPIMGVSLALFIIRCIAMYDIYKSLDPANCVLYLVLGILLSFLEPFFLFFNRDKDGGMPPRREEPIPEVPQFNQPLQWGEEPKDYL